jgi:hypothetical protein
MKTTVKKWIGGWIIDFYLADEHGNPVGEKIDTQEIARANAPTRWAANYAHSLRRKYRGAKVTYSIEKIG